MTSSFLGEYSQKVDGKGRMSIPAEFRAVLAEGDPDYPDNPLPRLIINYGPHLKGCLRAYTIEAMNAIEAGIKRMPPGSQDRKFASFVYLAKAWRSEIDKDGRIVLPQSLREQIGLQGEARMIALGEYFEIWNADTYAEADGAEVEEWLAKKGPGFDPLTVVFPQEGG